MKVLVTGSRAWRDPALIHSVLDVLLAEHDGLILVHGGCRTGADAIADRWACDRQQAGANILIDRFPANWGSYGRAAGMRRNADMVAAGADLCVSFFAPGQSNRGTAHCTKLARRAGIPIRRYPTEDDHA